MNEIELKSMDKLTLISKLKEFVHDERRITTEVLQCLREVESRMLFAEMGYSSLYEFCTQHLLYSEGSAHRRISAMRLLKNLPKTEQVIAEIKIREGTLTLTNLSTLQSFFKTEKKENGKIYSDEQKIELLHLIENQPKREVEKKLAVIQPKILPEESERILTPTLTEIKFIADDALLEKLKRIKEVISHQDLNPTYSDLFHRLADEYLKRKDPMEKVKRIEKNRLKNVTLDATSPAR